MTTDCSAPSTWWFAPNGIRWNEIRSSPAEKDTCRSGPWTAVVCCTNVWASSRAEISLDTSPASPSTKTATFSPATAMATSSSGLEVVPLAIIPR